MGCDIRWMLELGGFRIIELMEFYLFGFFFIEVLDLEVIWFRKFIDYYVG